MVEVEPSDCGGGAATAAALWFGMIADRVASVRWRATGMSKGGRTEPADAVLLFRSAMVLAHGNEARVSGP